MSVELNPREDLLIRKALLEWAKGLEAKADKEESKKRPDIFDIEGWRLIAREARALMMKLGGLP